MRFHGEGAWEVEIDGVAVFNVSDADGAPVGAFASEAAALGAQRAANPRKLILKKLPVEFDEAELWGCEAVSDDATSTYVFAEQVDGEWMVSESFDETLNERTLRSSKPF